MNLVILVGEIVRDVEYKATTQGAEVATFTVKTSQDAKNGPRNDFHRVVVWNPPAGLQNGNTVAIEGKLQTRSWEDKTSGEKKYMTEVVAFRCTNMSVKGAGVDNTTVSTTQKSNGAKPTYVGNMQETFMTEADVPF